MAVVLVERLLRPGAWLLLDDLDWTYANGSFAGPSDLSEAERTTPHVRIVWDEIVKPHASFAELREEDGSWGWARKAPGKPKRLEIAVTRTERSILRRRAELALRRIARR